MGETTTAGGQVQAPCDDAEEQRLRESVWLKMELVLMDSTGEPILLGDGPLTIGVKMPVGSREELAADGDAAAEIVVKTAAEVAARISTRLPAAFAMMGWWPDDRVNTRQWWDWDQSAEVTRAFEQAFQAAVEAGRTPAAER